MEVAAFIIALVVALVLHWPTWSVIVFACCLAASIAGTMIGD